MAVNNVNNDKICNVQTEYTKIHMYARFEVSVIYSLNIIDLNVTEKAWLPSEQFTSNNLQF